MADVTSKLKVSELDFDAIKSNLKNFLGDQNELADYISEYNMYHRILLNTVHKELHYYYNNVYIVHMNNIIQYIKYY